MFLRGGFFRLRLARGFWKATASGGSSNTELRRGGNSAETVEAKPPQE
jgi:hypothetical protein